MSNMVTNGAPQHFKNKYNFANLRFYKKNFGIELECHFHATAYKKSPWDGIGDNFKRLAARTSLQTSLKWLSSSAPKKIMLQMPKH